MKFVTENNYESLSKKAADFIISFVQNRPDSLISLAGGSTPKKTYEHLVHAGKQGIVDFGQCDFIILDEWVGLGNDMEDSCKKAMYDQFFSPLSIQEEKIHFFDGLSTDLQDDCNKMDAFIDSHGGIDFCVLGIGMDGHLGFNEPNTSFDSNSHVGDLDMTTIKDKDPNGDRNLNQGITLGVKQILDAKTALLMANGGHKADIIGAAFNNEMTQQVPASVLQKHTNAYVFLDQEASEELV